MKYDYSLFEEILREMEADGFIKNWVKLTQGQYRINNKLDVYPKSRKYFYVPTEERGEYEDLASFIGLIF